MVGIRHVLRLRTLGMAVLWVGWMLLPGQVESSYAASVTIYWTAPGDDGNTGTATSYDVRYSTSAITVGNWSSATTVTGEPAPSVAGSNESMTISGLVSNTQYFFAIITSDEVSNLSGLSNVLAIATDDETPPAAIVDLSATP